MTSPDTKAPSAREQLIALLSDFPEAAFLGKSIEEPFLEWLEPAQRQSFSSQLPGLLAGWNTKPDMLGLLSGVNGLAWEVACVKQAVEDGELLSSNARKLDIREKYARYEDKQPLSEPPQGWGDKVKIQNDVPIVRATEGGALPYVVEAKCSQRRPYGQAYGFGKNAREWIRTDALNQLLRYQFAIDHGKIAGATLELMGPVHPLVLDWVTDGLDGQGSRVPSLEVVWSLPLPSGAHARVWLKRGDRPGRLEEERVVLESDQACLSAFQQLREDKDRLREILRGEVPEDWHGLPERLRGTTLNPFGNPVMIAREPWALTDVEDVRAFMATQKKWVTERVLSALEPDVAPSVAPPVSRGPRPC